MFAFGIRVQSERSHARAITTAGRQSVEQIVCVWAFASALAHKVIVIALSGIVWYDRKEGVFVCSTRGEQMRRRIMLTVTVLYVV